MNNDIMKFLNIEDKDIIISKILIDGNTKIIYLENGDVPILNVIFTSMISLTLLVNINSHLILLLI